MVEYAASSSPASATTAGRTPRASRLPHMQLCPPASSGRSPDGSDVSDGSSSSASSSSSSSAPLKRLAFDIANAMLIRAADSDTDTVILRSGSTIAERADAAGARLRGGAAPSEAQGRQHRHCRLWVHIMEMR